MTQEAAVPAGLNDQMRRIAREEVAAAFRSAPLRNASITGGALTIKEGGRLVALYPESLGGEVGVYFGDIVDANTNDYLGTGVLIQAPDGTDIASFRSDDASGNPLVILRDGDQNTVLSTDTSGQGLARPYVPGAFYPSRFTDWISTSSATFETLFRAKIPKQHAKLYCRIWASNDTAGATGELRVMVNGVQLGVTQATGFVIAEEAFYAAVAGAHMADLSIEVQARLASGTGLVKVWPQSLDGRP